MKKKKRRETAYKPTLVTSELVPITDPAIQAALDELRHMENPVVPEILREYSREMSRRSTERKALAGKLPETKRKKS